MIKTLAIHELRVLIRSPFAWIAAALLQLIFGWLFLAAVEQFVQLPPGHAGSTAGLSSFLVVQFLAPASVVMMLATPLLCMNLIAAEHQTGRFALLTSAPVSATEIVLGKFTGALVFQFAIIALNTALIVALTALTKLDPGHLLSAVFGLLLFVTVATALSLFFSSLTHRPVLAAFMSFATLILLWLAAASSGAGALAQLSPSQHLNSFMQGLLDTRDVSYFICATAILLYLSVLRLNNANTSTLTTGHAG